MPVDPCCPYLSICQPVFLLLLKQFTLARDGQTWQDGLLRQHTLSFSSAPTCILPCPFFTRPLFSAPPHNYSLLPPSPPSLPRSPHTVSTLQTLDALNTVPGSANYTLLHAPCPYNVWMEVGGVGWGPNRKGTGWEIIWVRSG